VKLPPAALEQWYRDFPPETAIDLSSSGVAPYSFAEMRDLVGLEAGELDALVMGDSTSLGGLPLRQALADRFAGGEAERVMATSGSSEAIFLVLATLLHPDDEVVVLAPRYHSLGSVPALAGARLHEWGLGDEGSFAVDVERGCRAISSRTRAVIVNFPHNPTGVSLTEDELRLLVDAVEEAGAYLVWDAAFAELTYERPSLPDPTSLTPRAVSVGTFSKAYGLPGLRVGWCIGSPDVLTGTIGLHDATTLFLSPLVERIAERAIAHCSALLAPRLTAARRNLELLATWIEEHAELVRWTRPQGGVSAFLFLPTVEDVDSFCRRLAVEADVLLVPGTAFDRPGHVRLGFGGREHDFELGLDRLSSFLLATVRRRGVSRSPIGR
jgi:capreomycidine synthase